MTFLVIGKQCGCLVAKCESSTANGLPNLLYLGDVPVESSYHGSALLYRLLQRFPVDRLRVMENMNRSLPERRLAGVTYCAITTRTKRLLTTRLHRWASSFLSRSAPWRWRGIVKLLGDFKPQAVLTVAHGFSWMTAAQFARRSGLPLHFIVHDDWPGMVAGTRQLRAWVDRQFQKCYRNATSRLCVSPYMVDEYNRRYGVGGTVLYPSRAADANVFETPPERLRHQSPGLTAVFAGTINSSGDVRALQLLAGCLAEIQGRLLIFGPLTREQAAVNGLNRENIELRGLVTSSDLIRHCRDEADILFVPMSFLPENRANMEINFPSKLTDYTAIGLPLLINGPDNSSAVRWARENPGVAVVVTEESSETLGRALLKLQDPIRRVALADAAIRCGHEFFDNDRANAVFREALQTPRG